MTKEDVARSGGSAADIAPRSGGASTSSSAAQALRFDGCLFDKARFDSLPSVPLGVSIPDNVLTGIEVGWVQTPEEGLLIEEVVVDVNMHHTYAGDVVLGLYYDADNDGIGEIGPVLLMCTPGLVGCDFNGCCGCDGDLAGTYEFSDAATGVLGEVECTPVLAEGCYAVDSGSVPLSSFNGLADGGRFILYAWDWEGGDVGSVSDFTVWVKRGCNHPILNVPADYATVQAALDVACHNDVIRIAPGTYGDAILDLDGKSIRIEGTNPGNPPILGQIQLTRLGNGGRLDNLRATSVDIEARSNASATWVTAGSFNAVTFGRFTVQDSDVGTLILRGFRATVQNTVAGTISFDIQDDVRLINSISGPVLVDFYGSGGGAIEGNTIVSDDGDEYRSLQVLDYGDTLRLDRNIVIGRRDGTGIGIRLRPEAGAPARFPLCNDVWSCAQGWQGFVSGQLTDPTGLQGNISVNPLFCSRTNGDYHLAAASPCLPGHHPNGADCGQIGALGQGCSIAASVDAQPASDLSIVSAAPNPARGSVTFSIPAGPDAVRLRLFDAGGRTVRTLLLPPSQGPRRVTWDQRNEMGAAVPTGVYFCQASNDRSGAVRQVIVLR